MGHPRPVPQVGCESVGLALFNDSKTAAVLPCVKTFFLGLRAYLDLKMSLWQGGPKITEMSAMFFQVDHPQMDWRWQFRS